MLTKNMVKPVILLISCSVVIGISSYTFLNSLLSDVLIPAIPMLLSTVSRSKYFDKFLLSREFSFINFISQFVVYTLAIAITYLITVFIIKRNKLIETMKGGDRYNTGDYYNIDEEDAGLEDIDFDYEMNNLDENIDDNNMVSTTESGPDTIDMGMPTDIDMTEDTGMLSIDGFTGNFASV